MSYVNKYNCPNCGARLNRQTGFDPNNGTWICKSCGQLLYGDDIYDGDSFPGVMWYCDNCGELLNRQRGFSDNYRNWKCKKCGHINNISEDEIINTEKRYDPIIFESDEQSDENDDLDVDDFDDVEDNESSLDPETSAALASALIKGFSAYSEYQSKLEERRLEELRIKKEKEQRLEENERIKKERARVNKIKRLNFYKTHWKMLSLILLILCISTFGAFKYKEFEKSIVIGVSSDELIGIPYQSAVRILQKSGFTNVITDAIEDLSIYDLSEEEIVSGVSVRGKTTFDDDYRCPYDAAIRIEYHLVEKKKVPLSSKEVKKLDYNDVYKLFLDAGFINIELSPKADVVIGLLAKENSVESVSINGNNSFEQNDTYRPDVKIIIEYHTKK